MYITSIMVFWELQNPFLVLFCNFRAPIKTFYHCVKRYKECCCWRKKFFHTLFIRDFSKAEILYSHVLSKFLLGIINTVTGLVLMSYCTSWWQFWSECIWNHRIQWSHCRDFPSHHQCEQSHACTTQQGQFDQWLDYKSCWQISSHMSWYSYISAPTRLWSNIFRLRLRQNLFNKNIQVPYQVHISFLEIQIAL